MGVLKRILESKGSPEDFKTSSDVKKGADEVAKRMSKESVLVVPTEAKIINSNTDLYFISASFRLTYDCKSKYIDSEKYKKFEGYVYFTEKFYKDFEKAVLDVFGIPKADLIYNNDGSIISISHIVKK